ncbi:MAG TPA: TolC family protein [Verrucomicrobiae bacterium]|nr:TolC family protein [Verrucomicrobiae bacterium]
MKPFALIAFSCAFSAVAFGQTTNAPAFLSLADAEKIALQYHPQIKQADYLALAAQEVVKESRSGFFPTVNLYADAVGVTSEGARITAGGLNNPSVYDRGAGGGQLNQLITDFGRTANLTASSKYQAQAEGQNANETREQVLLQVDGGYFGALEAQAVLRVAQQTYDTRKTLLDQITALATNKIRSELDVSFAQVELQQASLLVEQSSNNADAAMATLSTALGYGEYHEFQLADQPPQTNNFSSDVSGMVQTALSRRPELLSLRYDREAAMRFARAQRDARLPTVEAVGVAGAAPWRDDNYLKSDYFAGGVQLSVPVFAGGLYVSRQREAQLKADADAELLRSVENNVIRDVRIAWLNLNDAVQQLQTTEELAANATEAFTLAEARYNNGISDIVELSDAQLNLTQAQIAETNARYNVFIQQANLNYQMGIIQ